MIEYYKGILIMTSNRADNIDSAFQSRIHLTMHYPELGTDARLAIWRQFVANAGWPNELTEEAYDKLSKLKMNGRQIKNVVKISFLLASRGNAPLSLDHIRAVVQATKEAGLEGHEL